jgi:folate-binding protein YgfZ
LDFEGVPICTVCASYTGEEGFDLIVPVAELEKIARRLDSLAPQFGAVWAGQEAFEILRVEAGIPRYGKDFSEDNLILETNLDTTHVSYTKGCYLGQEIVERVRSRGHVNRKLRGLVLDDQRPARHGDAIIAGEKQVGTVTSSVLSPELARAVALGTVHRDHWLSGTRLGILGEGTRRSATIAELPFIKR